MTQPRIHIYIYTLECLGLQENLFLGYLFFSKSSETCWIRMNNLKTNLLEGLLIL